MFVSVFIMFSIYYSVTSSTPEEIVFKFSEGYKDFLSQCKTERESVREAVRLAEECGFKPLESFSSLKEGGVTLNMLAVLIILLGCATCYTIHLITGEELTTMIGVLSGAVTNTPGLGAAQQTITDTLSNPEVASQVSNRLASAYALAYPLGVIGIIVSMLLVRYLFRVKLDREKQLAERSNAPKTVRIDLKVSNKGIIGKKIEDIIEFHVRFERIHPFGDGNGRIGRLITNLQLKECDLLDLPVLCLSNYWKKNKGNYYNAISNARYANNIEYWVRFFLSSIYSASKERIDAIIKINETLNKYKKILEKGEQDNSNIILTHLIKASPFITAKEAQNLTGSTYQGANKIIEKFVHLGILKEYSQNKRNRIFVFDEYDKLIFNLMDDLN